MARLYLLCGKTGSGKTSYAVALERENRAFLLSADELMLALYGAHMTRREFEERLSRCKSVLLGIAARLLAREIDVVLDWGFWTRLERHTLRARFKNGNVEVDLIYFDVSDELLLARLTKRNDNREPGTFEITEDMFRAFSLRFEPPGADEGFRAALPRRST